MKTENDAFRDKVARNMWARFCRLSGRMPGHDRPANQIASMVADAMLCDTAPPGWKIESTFELALLEIWLGESNVFSPQEGRAVECMPGSAEKVAAMAARVEAGEEIFHKEDRRRMDGVPA